MIRIVAILILCLAVLSCGSEPAPEDPPRPVAPIRPVEIYRIEPRAYEDRASEFGTLVPSETLTLSAQIVAEVVEMEFSEGEDVKPGQLLYRLDSRDLELRLGLQRAALGEARVAIAKAVADMKRAETLLDKGVATQQSHDDSGFALDAAKARIDTIQAEMALTQRELEKTRIVAPGRYKAVIVQARVGSLVMPGQPTVTLAAIDPLELILSLPSHRAGILRVGNAVTIYVEGITRAVSGRVHDITFPVPPDQGFVTVRIRVANPKRDIYPGQSARVDLVVEARDDLVWVPAEAVIERFGSWGVYVLDGDVARFRGIRKGRVSGNFIEAVEGIDLAEPVIVVGQADLATGDRVDVRAGR
jgi:RND family efflux transporter MFP subunit